MKVLLRIIIQVVTVLLIIIIVYWRHSLKSTDTHIKGEFCESYKVFATFKGDTFTIRGDDGALSCSNQIYEWFTTLETSTENIIANLIIEDGFTSIGDSAFYNCVNLTSVTIPNSVNFIGRWAFGRCTNLKNVTIGSGTIEILENFKECPNLISIDIQNTHDENKTFFFSIDGVLFLRAYRNPTIDNILLIMQSKQPNENKTFELIQYPQGKQGAYIIPDGVTHIGWEAFYRCTGLIAVTIPNSVISIGKDAFAYCENLMSVISLGMEPPDVHSLYELPDESCLYVPETSIEAYRVADGWRGFKCIKPISVGNDKGKL